MTTPVPEPDDRAFRVLVFAPHGRDAALTGELLREAGLTFEICPDMTALCRALAEGAGTALVTEELLSSPDLDSVHAVLAQQPAWSDFPFIVFGAGPGDANDANAPLAGLGNVLCLERPVKVRAMIAAVRSALRGRARQYEARRAIESRDQFLAMLGHELRNPLGAIRLAVELIRLRKDGAGAGGKHVDVIDRQAKHLSRLVDDLLDVARVTYGKVTLHKTPVDLVEAAVTAHQALEPAAASGQLDFALSVPKQPIVVVGDRVRIDQVLGNLVMNAIKYTPRGGSVRVAVRREGSRGVVSVTDSGIGIAPAMLPRVFDLFAQADRTLDRAQGGMGLGLTLVRSLVRLHGGEVEAKSVGLGHGSEFIVRLPLDTSGAATAGTARGAASSASPKRIVVVEDGDDIRTLLTELLREDGHDVSVASDGGSGVDTILSVRPDVALVDIGLPGFDGYEVARRVRAAGGDAYLVALTGYGQPEDRRRATDAGFDTHLTKPVTYAALVGALGPRRSAVG